MNKSFNYDHDAGISLNRLKSFTVRDLPKSERPRERLIEHGADKLSSPEILSLILNTGSRGEPVMMLSQKLIMHFGSLKGIMQASFEDLRNVKGLGEAKASKLMACFEIAKRASKEEREDLELAEEEKKKFRPVTSPDGIYRIVSEKITNFSKEHFYVISLDIRNNFIGIDEISVGTLTASLVHPRETFESAIRRHAASIIIAHNHPSCETDPSEDDLKITKRLVEAGKIMGIEVLDHIIFTTRSYLSFKDKNLI
ncbi:MAG: DNA repair protein RadC [Bacteroidetes bacterium]|nr:DNA repair protein RadC [Bacteroidota bacterium]